MDSEGIESAGKTAARNATTVCNPSVTAEMTQHSYNRGPLESLIESSYGCAFNYLANNLQHVTAGFCCFLLLLSGAELQLPARSAVGLTLRGANTPTPTASLHMILCS